MATEVSDHPSPPLSFNQYVVGVRFRPTDQQLLQYLRCKIYGLPYFQGAVFDCDLYGGNEPWDIWEHFKAIDGQDLYFFTKLKRSTNKSGRSSAHINRKIGLAEGTWSGENKANPIFVDQTDERIIIGYTKRFRYENKLVPDHNGEWIMHEYSLHENLITNDADPDYVLCRIRKNERPKRKAENICMQPTNKRIMADDPKMFQMRKNETSSRKTKKICYSELQPTEQPTEQGTTNESYKPEMTTDHGSFEIPLEMTIDHGSFEIPLEMTTDHGSFEIPPEMTTDHGSFEIPPEMTTDHGSFEIPLEMTTDHGSFEIPLEIPYQDINGIPFEMPTYEGTSDVLNNSTSNQDSNYEEWLNENIWIDSELLF